MREGGAGGCTGVWVCVWCGREKDAPLGQVDNVWVASGSGGSYYLQRRGGGGRFIAWRQRVKKRASLRKLD